MSTISAHSPTSVPPTAPVTVRYATDAPATTADRKIAELALTFLGCGGLAPDQLSETATWDRSNALCTIGRTQIIRDQAGLVSPVSATVSQIVSEGKASTVSGRLTRDGIGVSLFCVVLRFETPTRAQIAQVVSFEQKELV